MNTFEILNYDESTLRTLYEVYHIRTDRIGELFGKDPTSIQKMLVSLGVPKLPRAAQPLDVNLINLFVPKKKAKDQEADIVARIGLGMNDRQISDELGIPYHRVGYFRTRQLKAESGYVHGTPGSIAMKGAPISVLKDDYYKLTKEELSKKYQVAPETIRRHLRDAGVAGKRQALMSAIPALVPKQLHLIIGSMLGDAGINNGRYKEYHCTRQLGYLQMKHDILKPYSLDIYPEDSGSTFCTMTHPSFRVLEEQFYREGAKGKLIPLELISRFWDPSILAYWYLDDGSYDPESNQFYIANKCPEEGQIQDLLLFLEDRYAWGFKYSRYTEDGVFCITIDKENYDKFFEVVASVAPACMLGKLPKHMVQSDSVGSEVLEVVPADKITTSLYAAMNEEAKLAAERALFVHYRAKGFPYPSLTDKRLAADFRSVMSALKYPIYQILDGRVHISNQNHGSRLLEHFFPNMYDGSRKGYLPPTKAWESDDKLMALVRNRLKYADNISDASFRKGIKLTWGAVYNYRSATAVQVFKAFNTNGLVLDYSAGFGARMLAASALGLEYHGFDPNTETYNNLRKMDTWMSEHGDSTPRHLYCQGSEEMEPPEGVFGLAFSSPPYFDLENYCDEGSQSVKKFPDRGTWMTGYWEEVVKRSIRSLTPEGVFAVCLSPYSCSDIIQKTEEVCSSLGFRKVAEISVPLQSVLQSGSETDRAEVVLAYSRGEVVSCIPTKADTFQKPERRHSPVVKVATPSMEAKKVADKEESIRERNAACIRVASLLVSCTRKEADELRASGQIPYSGLEMEKFFGTWNAYLAAAGKTPNRVFRSDMQDISEYLSYCLGAGSVLSFYTYGVRTGRTDSTSRLKRLFAPGGKLRDCYSGLQYAVSSEQAVESYLAKVETLI